MGTSDRKQRAIVLLQSSKLDYVLENSTSHNRNLAMSSLCLRRGSGACRASFMYTSVHLVIIYNGALDWSELKGQSNRTNASARTWKLWRFFFLIEWVYLFNVELAWNCYVMKYNIHVCFAEAQPNSLQLEGGKMTFSSQAVRRRGWK